MNFRAHKQKLLKNKDFREAYEASELEYQIARAIINKRLEKGLTQKELAKKLNTQQSVISRVENARTISSLSFLKRVASELESSLHVEFK